VDKPFLRRDQVQKSPEGKGRHSHETKGKGWRRLRVTYHNCSGDLFWGQILRTWTQSHNRKSHHVPPPPTKKVGQDKPVFLEPANKRARETDRPIVLEIKIMRL
jgi:hypothetical protein